MVTRPGREQKFQRVMCDQHPAWHRLRQAIHEQPLRIPAFLVGLELRDLRGGRLVPGNGVALNTPPLVRYIGRPDAAPVREAGERRPVLGLGRRIEDGAGDGGGRLHGKPDQCRRSDSPFTRSQRHREFSPVAHRSRNGCSPLTGSSRPIDGKSDPPAACRDGDPERERHAARRAVPAGASTPPCARKRRRAPPPDDIPACSGPRRQ